MVDSLDDGRDFNKARGFLLTYSALVLALWYFGADLTQFKLMGNEVKLLQRTNSVWLVLAVLNAYFWFRCYQRIPPNGLYFDGAMDNIYEKFLLRLALVLGRRKLKRKILSDLVSRGRGRNKYIIDSYHSQISKRPSRNKEERRRGVRTLRSRILLEEYRVQVFLTVKYRYQLDDGWKEVDTSEYYTLNVALTWPAKALTIIRGAFTTPWFTDHVAPLLLGGLSTAFALWKWYDLNFLASTLQHHTLMCAGVATVAHGYVLIPV